MKLNKAELLKALKADLKAAEVLKKDQDALIDKWRKEYDGEPYGNEQKGKSRIVSRDIKKQSEWQHASIVDPFVNNPNVIKCDPVTWEDVDAAKQNELLLNTQFSRKFDRYNFITKAAKVLDREGTVVIQTGWDYEEEEVEVEEDVIVIDEYGNESVESQIVTNTIVKKNQPTAKVCRNEDIYIDPTCQDNLENAQFVGHRYETDLSTLRSDGRYKNLDRVAKAGSSEDPDYNSPDDTDFQFTDKARKKILVHEYWGNYDIDDDGIVEPIVCAWVGDTIIRLETNPYPDKKPPFIVVPFNSVPFKVHGEANAELIGVNQKVKTAIIRGIIDNMAQSNNAQVGLRKGSLDTINRKKFLSGKNFEFNNTVNDFYKGSYNAIPGSVFDMIGLMNNEIESITGIKGFSGGITGNSLGATATGVRGALDAASTRRVNIVRNIAENLVKPLMRKWMAYNTEFLEEEEVIRVTNKDFVPIRRDDLEGHIDIDIEISTAEDNAAKSQELSFLLQTVGPNEDPAVRRELMANIMELMRMPNQAKKIREYQPQANPIEEQIRQLEVQQLQLKNQNLAIEAEVLKGSINGTTPDALLKQKRAEVETMKARKLDSEADLLDMRFLQEDSQLPYQQKLEQQLLRIKAELEKERVRQEAALIKEGLRHKANMQQMAYQAHNNDSNIGIY